MNEILSIAINSCNSSELSYCKFIAPNDTKATKSHQSGFHISKSCYSLFFDTPGQKGYNKDVIVKIKWQNDFETESRFIYYGQETRNEYRLTRFDKGFPFREEHNIGDLLIISKKEDRYYDAFVLSSDDDIEDFFNAFGISSTETNQFIPKNSQQKAEDLLLGLFQQFMEKLTEDFPSTAILASGARTIFTEAYKHGPKNVLKSPDLELLAWISTEYDLFKFIENDRYGSIIKTPFPTVDSLITTANSILNRRKSRAGKSLEHHLSEAFNLWKIPYSAQAVTEENKKPDFIFPNIETYYKSKENDNNLTFLGAKTTCKDRWRQIVNEADKIPQKHLFTLQQGISANQLNEMKKYGVTLVVPKPYLSTFPEQCRGDIWTLNQFLGFAKRKYGQV